MQKDRGETPEMQNADEENKLQTSAFKIEIFFGENQRLA